MYETTIIVNAALEDEDIDAVITKVTGYIENHGGEILTVDKWGRRRLAYPINKKYNGFYIHIEFNAQPETAPILERFLVLEDTVLRHLTLVLPKKLKDYREKTAKLQAERAAAEEKAKEEQAVESKKSDKKDSAEKDEDKKETAEA